jgi:hypothetical protein
MNYVYSVFVAKKCLGQKLFVFSIIGSEPSSMGQSVVYVKEEVKNPIVTSEQS